MNWFQPDDIMLKLKDVLPSNYYVNIDDFAAKLLEEDKFRPFGQMIDCYVRKCHETFPQRTFEIYKVSWVVIEDSKYIQREFSAICLELFRYAELALTGLTNSCLRTSHGL